MPRTREGAPERETDNGKERVEPDANDNTNAMRCTRLHDMNECHTRNTTKRRKPKRQRTRNGIDEAGDILYTQKGKYYIRGITIPKGA